MANIINQTIIPVMKVIHDSMETGKAAAFMQEQIKQVAQLDNTKFFVWSFSSELAAIQQHISIHDSCLLNGFRQLLDEVNRG